MKTKLPLSPCKGFQEQDRSKQSHQPFGNNQDNAKLHPNIPGGGLLYGTDRDARRKFWIQPLKETIWEWHKQILTPKRDR